MKVLIIVAHPDDESFFGGGTIAKLAKKGHRIVLVSATRGEKGELGTPPLATRETIGKVRESEQRNAAKYLGISEIHYLDFIDGELTKIGEKEFEKKLLPIFTAHKPDV